MGARALRADPIAELQVNLLAEKPDVEVGLDAPDTQHVPGRTFDRRCLVRPSHLSVEERDVVLHHPMDVRQVLALLQGPDLGSDAIGEGGAVDVRVGPSTKQAVENAAAPSGSRSEPRHHGDHDHGAPTTHCALATVVGQ